MDPSMYSRAGKASGPNFHLLSAVQEKPQPRMSIHQLVTGKRPPPKLENSEDYDEILKCFNAKS